MTKMTTKDLTMLTVDELTGKINALQDKLDASLNPAEVGKFLTVGDTGAIAPTAFNIPDVPESPEEGDSYSLKYSSGAWSWSKNE